MESGKALYLPIAAESTTQKALIKLILGLTITNQETATVHVTGVTFSFPGSAVAAVAMQVTAFDITAGQSKFWVNGVFNNNANNGEFIVKAVTDTVLTVAGTLVNETASGDEKIVVHVPKTGIGRSLLKCLYQQTCKR